MKRTLAVFLALAALPLFAQQSVKTPRVSQRQKVTQTAGLTDITITYSRPGVKGRSVWGTLVPYGAVWRTGANEATTIQFSDDVTIDGQKVPAGTYSLHTIPGQNEWTIILNSVADQWGSYSYDQAKDVLRFKATPQKSSTFHEWLTFEFPQISTDAATVAIAWENVMVPFTVNTNSTQKTLANLTTALNASKTDAWRLPYVAASFAFENNAPEQAQTWLDQSIATQQTVQNLWLKARMQAKAGNKTAARQTAELAISKATPNDGPFVEQIRKDMAGW